LVTGASDDDPSGIATYTQAGASFGFGLLWAALFTLPLAASVQEICDRTALATGKTLGQLARERFTRTWSILAGGLIALLIAANTLNIAADLVAVGSGMQLLHAGPAFIWALVAGVATSALLIGGSFKVVARVFKMLCLALFSYLAMLVAVQVRWTSVLYHAVVPHLSFDKNYLALLVAVLGTTISPYLFFWQSIHRVEEMREERAGGNQPKPLWKRSGTKARQKQLTSRVDVFGGFLFSNLVMFAIIVATAATLGRHGKHNIQSAAEAATALRPIAGQFAQTLFALGFIGSGMLAVPVLAGAGSAAMAGLLGRPVGFSRSPQSAPVFYALVLVGTLGGTALSLVGVNPIKLLVVVAVINGVAAAPFLALVMRIADDKSVMRDAVNGPLARMIGWGTTGVMLLAAVVLFSAGGGGGLY
jgi:NRAMP (natural resistance-associated macrophage protein)-like metal ion transporter